MKFQVERILPEKVEFFRIKDRLFLMKGKTAVRIKDWLFLM